MYLFTMLYLSNMCEAEHKQVTVSVTLFVIGV